MAEKEYIERGALIEHIKQVYCSGCNSYNGVGCRACLMGDAIDFIEDAPAADVAPVVHGKWLNCKNGNGTCSACNIRWKGIYDDDNEQSYCGCCGAKMDGGKK